MRRGGGRDRGPHPGLSKPGGKWKQREMVAGRRLELKGRFVFQIGKLESCWRFRGSSHRSRWVTGGKEVPVEDIETGTERWAQGVKRGRAEREAGWREGAEGTSAPGHGALWGPTRPVRGAGTGSGQVGVRVGLAWACIPAPPSPAATLRSPCHCPPSESCPREPVHERHPAQGGRRDLDTGEREE